MLHSLYLCLWLFLGALLYPQYLSVHALDLSDCGANAGSGCIRDVLLGAAHGVAVDHCCSCSLPVQTDCGLEIVAGPDLFDAVATAECTEAGSSLLRCLLPESAAVSCNSGQVLVSLCSRGSASVLLAPC